eukprot:431813-Amphidinium_carterae.1
MSFKPSSFLVVPVPLGHPQDEYAYDLVGAFAGEASAECRCDPNSSGRTHEEFCVLANDLLWCFEVDM